MNTLIALFTIVHKETHRFLRIWPQTLLPPAISTSLYFLIFGKLIGDRVGSINGVSYMDYIVPGVILMSVISHAYSNVASSFYAAKFQSHVEELLVAPVSNWVILVGYLSGGILRGLMVGCVVAMISLLFTQIQIHNVAIILVTAFLTATLFALAGFINAVFANSFDDISLIPNFILTPLNYLGGVFYSVAMLPEIWQHISLANPILYMINSFRYGFLGISDIAVELALGRTVGFIVLLTLICLNLLQKGIGIRD
ncbi:MAG: ABC transporter permease [Methylococcales bacterium]|nr:ABC transporter permease [Methylococcales bacterium]